MKHFFHTVFCLVVIFGTIACKKEPVIPECTNCYEGYVISVEAPATVEKGQPFDVHFTTGLNYVCDKFSHTVVTEEGNTRQVSVSIANSVACVAMPGTVDTMQSFTFCERGSFILNFHQTNGNFVSDTVVVE